MRTFKFILPLAVAMLFSTALRAEEAKKDDAPKGTSVSLEGSLANPSNGGQASLKVKDEKKNTKTYTLWAKDDVAKQLAELLKDHKKGSDVNVSGTLAPDGVNIQVSSISEGDHKKK